MSDPIALLHTFYTSFQARDLSKMMRCYHENATFCDPVFGHLSRIQIEKMWTQLLEKGDPALSIIYTLDSDNTVRWEAIYRFSLTNRQITNKVHSNFEFSEGLSYPDYVFGLRNECLKGKKSDT